MFDARRMGIGTFAVLVVAGALADTKVGGADSEPKVVDLSVLVSEEYPCTWAAGFPPFLIHRDRVLGPMGAYHLESLTIDENTGTQFDAPAHSIPPPGTPFPDAGPMGKITGDQVPAWQFVGEACVIDCRDLIEAGGPNKSALVTRQRIEQWEKKHRPLGPGDAVLFHSGYSDRFYLPFPAGARFLAQPLDNRAPAWPDPDPDAMAYLATRKVMTLGTDSPSMGPLPKELAADTHTAGLRHGMAWTESATGLGQMPPTGAAYCMLPVKHFGGAGGETRAFAITEPVLAGRLIDSAKRRQVVDLSVLNAEDLPVWWPGAGTGQHRTPYLRKILLTFEQTQGKGFAQTHFMDSHTGTHLVPPSFALPGKVSSEPPDGPAVRPWLAEFEAKYGRRGTSDLTTEKIPIEQTCGPVRIIDTKSFMGTTDQSRWPSSPELTVAHIQADERRNGPLRAGEIVLFSCGWTEDYFRPLPEGDACFAAPLRGEREGWPAPGPDAIGYLASKGIRCVGTDSPTLGGVDPKSALMTYWALGQKGMVGVEYLTNLSALAGKDAYFLFAATKIEGCNGGPGRAIAVY